MHARTQAHLFEIFNWVMLLVGIPIFFCLAISSSGNLLPPFLFAGLCLVLLLALLFSPVRCSVPGCGGSMRQTTTRLSPFKGRMKYQCTVCEDTYEVEIFMLPEVDN